MTTKIAFFEKIMKCALVHTKGISKIMKGSALSKRDVFYGFQIYFYQFFTTIPRKLVHNLIYSTGLTIFPNGLHNSQRDVLAEGAQWWLAWGHSVTHGWRPAHATNEVAGTGHGYACDE